MKHVEITSICRLDYFSKLQRRICIQHLYSVTISHTILLAFIVSLALLLFAYFDKFQVIKRTHGLCKRLRKSNQRFL